MRQYLKHLLIFLIYVMLISCENKEKSPSTTDMPNIILILSDDQGWGDLSLMGNTNLNTPNIDAIGRNGATFDRFYVSPVCSPTRAELLTGRYHPRGGVYSTSAGGERLDLDETTIADILKEAGYTTAAFGKWHNGMQYPYHPNARGFEEFYGFCSGHWGNYFSPLLEHNGELVRGNGFVIDDFTDHAIQFIEDNRDNPFFLYLPYNTPHSPMQVPDEYWERFKEKELQLLHRDVNLEDIQFTRAALAMCENIDWNVGRLIKKVNDLKIDKNTIIIYLSDNGPNGWRWNGGMKGRKGSTDEGGVRSPLLIQWKGHIHKGITIEPISSAIDLLPTLCDLAGIETGSLKAIDGLSLKPLLFNKKVDWPNRLIFNHWRERTSVRNQQYRLDFENKLFDMINDPGQYKDITKDHPDIHEYLVHAKIAWENEVLSELPLVDDRPFPVGHPDFKYTQLPARDGVPHGNIQRSNQYPNCSYFTNWISQDDSITWEIEVLEEGDFNVILYYTCSVEDAGTLFELSINESVLRGRISDAHDPPEYGMGQDRVQRIESYVKDFKPLSMGHIHLNAGKGVMTLRALEIPGKEAMDLRMLMLERKGI